MISTLYRRAAAAPAAPMFDPDSRVDPESVDDLAGAVPTWRPAGDPVLWELVRDVGGPAAYVAALLDVDEALVVGRGEREHALAPDVSESSRLDGDVDDVPTVALRILPTVALPVVDDDECPDCGATGVEPCRPKSNPTGHALSRRHRRRRQLVEHRDAGFAAVEFLVVSVLVGLVLALAVLASFAPMPGGLGTPTRTPSPCPAGTAPGCPDGPRVVVP
jgi:hypothetical protein